MKSNQKIAEPDKRRTKKSPETITERVHRHINDINSKITDEDIRNVRMELEIRSEPPLIQERARKNNQPQKKSSKKARKTK